MKSFIMPPFLWYPMIIHFFCNILTEMVLKNFMINFDSEEGWLKNTESDTYRKVEKSEFISTYWICYINILKILFCCVHLVIVYKPFVFDVSVYFQQLKNVSTKSLLENPLQVHPKDSFFSSRSRVHALHLYNGMEKI